MEIPIDIINKVNQEDKAFEEYMSSLKKHADKVKDQFLKAEPFSLTQNIGGINFLTGVYLGVVFFPDKEVIEKFNQFGIPQKELRWLTDVHELREIFNSIEESVIIYRNEIMRHLIVHLSIRITSDVIKWAEVYEKTRSGFRMQTPTSQIEKAIDRRKKPAIRKYLSTKEKEITNAFADEILRLSKENAISTTSLTGLIKGQVEKSFYIDWLLCSFPYPVNVIKSNKFLTIIFPLLELIFKDERIPNLSNIGDYYPGKSEEVIRGQYFRKLIFKK